jgi:hypothetical protein
MVNDIDLFLLESLGFIFIITTYIRILNMLSKEPHNEQQWEHQSLINRFTSSYFLI